MPRRVRRRYLAIKVSSEKPVSRGNAMEALWNAVLQLFGEFGASQANLRFLEFDSPKDYAVVRCSHAALEMVRASIASVTEIDGKRAVFHVLGVSGTLKSLRRKVTSE